MILDCDEECRHPMLRSDSQLDYFCVECGEPEAKCVADVTRRSRSL